MEPVINPTDEKTCPFLKGQCLGAECALFLNGIRACAITATAVYAGNLLGVTERRD